MNNMTATSTTAPGACLGADDLSQPPRAFIADPAEMAAGASVEPDLGGRSAGEVLLHHGIDADILTPIMQIQELAMAITLLGRYSVWVEYLGNYQRFQVYVREGKFAAPAPDGTPRRNWLHGTILRRLGVTLAIGEDADRQREDLADELDCIAYELQSRLEEGRPS